MQDRETCVECGALSPEKNEDHTLTSSMGWRLTRERGPDGELRVVWRCGDCWAKHKAQAKAQPPSTRKGARRK